MSPQAQHLLHRQVDHGVVPRFHLHGAAAGRGPAAAGPRGGRETAAARSDRAGRRPRELRTAVETSRTEWGRRRPGGAGRSRARRGAGRWRFPAAQGQGRAAEPIITIIIAAVSASSISSGGRRLAGGIVTPVTGITWSEGGAAAGRPSGGRLHAGAAAAAGGSRRQRPTEGGGGSSGNGSGATGAAGAGSGAKGEGSAPRRRGGRSRGARAPPTKRRTRIRNGNLIKESGKEWGCRGRSKKLTLARSVSNKIYIHLWEDLKGKIK